MEGRGLQVTLSTDYMLGCPICMLLPNTRKGAEAFERERERELRENKDNETCECSSEWGLKNGRGWRNLRRCLIRVPGLKASRGGKERTKVPEKYRIVGTESNVISLKKTEEIKENNCRGCIKDVGVGLGVGWAGLR